MTNGEFEQPPDIPGLTLRRPLGRGGHGMVWLADDAATGGPVAVKISAEKRLLEQELALLCRIDHPHVLRLLRVVPVAGGSALVLQFAAGGSLADLIARRGPLRPGEVSTMLVPLAAAVEHLHRRGLVHGDVTPGNVLFGADGKPLLGDLGAARLIGAINDKPWQTAGFTDSAISTGADPRAVDVWGLGAVGWFALTGRSPSERPGVRADHETASRAGALVRLLAECLADDPATRPEPTEIARRAWDAAQPAPIRLARPDGTRPDAAPPDAAPPDAAPPDAAQVSAAVTVPAAAWSFSQQVTTPPLDEPDAPEAGRPDEHGGRARRWSRSGAVAAVVAGMVVLVSVAAAVAVTTGPHPRPGPTAAHGQPVETVPPSSPDLPAVLEGISAARAAAFHTVSLDQLAWADEPGSPAATADARLVRRLRTSGRRLDGVSFRVTQVHPINPAGTEPTGTSGAAAAGQAADPSRAGRSADTITVTALVSTSGYRQVRVHDGAGVAMPAQPPRRVTLTLARIDGSWRVRSIVAVASTG